MRLPAFAGGGTSPFAHLLGHRKPDAKTAVRAETENTTDDDERKQRDGEADDDYAKRMKALDEKEKDEEAKRAEEEDKKPADEEEGDARNGRRAEDDDEDEAKSKKAEARGRSLERARGDAIFSCRAAADRPDLAAQLAFKTSMSAEEAIGVLTTAASGERRAPGLASRMSAVEVPHVASDAAPAPSANDPAGKAALIIAAGKKRRGEI